MPDWSSIFQCLADAGIAANNASAAQPVGGGDINAAWALETKQGRIFLKTGAASAFEMFDAEAEGLMEIASAKVLRVPEVLAIGNDVQQSFLALEWLPLQRADTEMERLLGEQLANMHRVVKGRFGWHRDNTIGRTPQCNTWSANWAEFFAEQRIAFQLRLAAEKGFGGEIQELGAGLLSRLPAFFKDYSPVPSLLHGDLWGGNWSSSNGVPVIFDPAVYYGDRETDLAMTRLFGGFGRAFYDAYESAWPLQPGNSERRDLYQLYHVLNHLNLFGQGYLSQALRLLRNL